MHRYVAVLALLLTSCAHFVPTFDFVSKQCSTPIAVSCDNEEPELRDACVAVLGRSILEINQAVGKPVLYLTDGNGAVPVTFVEHLVPPEGWEKMLPAGYELLGLTTLDFTKDESCITKAKVELNAALVGGWNLVYLDTVTTHELIHLLGGGHGEGTVSRYYTAAPHTIMTPAVNDPQHSQHLSDADKRTLREMYNK